MRFSLKFVENFRILRSGLQILDFEAAKVENYWFKDTRILIEYVEYFVN